MLRSAPSMPAIMPTRVAGATVLKRRYEQVGLFLTLLSLVVMPIGFWLLFMTPRPCNIDFCSGTIATGAGATLLWAWIVSFGVGAALLRASAKPQ